MWPPFWAPSSRVPRLPLPPLRLGVASSSFHVSLTTFYLHGPTTIPPTYFPSRHLWHYGLGILPDPGISMGLLELRFQPN